MRPCSCRCRGTAVPIGTIFKKGTAMVPFFMLQQSTIQLLRFVFSFFLMPVYLFAVSQVHDVSWPDALLVFLILHVLVYPSSNGYNSYMDRDTGPIVGVEKPLQPTKQLFYASIIMDTIAIVASLFISLYFAAGILLYILSSRAYSYRGIRLKKYPITGYLIVVLFQGALIFFLSYHGSSRLHELNVPVWGHDSRCRAHWRVLPANADLPA